MPLHFGHPIVPSHVPTFTADGKVKQELHQIVLFQYFNDFKVYVVNRGDRLHKIDGGKEFAPSMFCQLAREKGWRWRKEGSGA